MKEILYLVNIVRRPAGRTGCVATVVKIFMFHLRRKQKSDEKKVGICSALQARVSAKVL
jgi:hypothetical protein